MGPIGRIKRCAALLEQRLEECFARFGMTMWEFDVLATLRRSGAPFCLTPTALFSTLMVTSGTMTHRMKAWRRAAWCSACPTRRTRAACWCSSPPRGWNS
jgi:hypothetical protein